MTTHVKIELPADAPAKYVDVYAVEKHEVGDRKGAHGFSFLLRTIGRGETATEYVHSARNLMIVERHVEE